MIVIGTDTHKYKHALAAVDEGTGRARGSREIDADDAGHLAAVKWARGLDDERVWAIEDCRHVSRRLEQALIAAGERVVRVAPHRMGASRKGEREPGKSDEIDSLAVARAVVKDGVEQFPAAYLDERAMQIRLLADRRHRRREGAFLVEGIQPVWRAVEAGWDIEALIVSPELLAGSGPAAEMVAAQEARGVRVARLTSDLFSRLSDREGPAGLAAIVRSRHAVLEDLAVRAGSVFVALHRIGNPGNPDAAYIVFDGTDSGYSPEPANIPAFVASQHPGVTYNVIYDTGGVYVFHRSGP